MMALISEHITWKKWKTKLDAIFRLCCRCTRCTTSVVFFFFFYSEFDTWTIDQIKAVVNITAATFLFIFLTRDLGIWVQHLSDKPVMELLSGCIRTAPNCSDFVSSMRELPLCLSLNLERPTCTDWRHTFTWETKRRFLSKQQNQLGSHFKLPSTLWNILQLEIK